MIYFGNFTRSFFELTVGQVAKETKNAYGEFVDPAEIKRATATGAELEKAYAMLGRAQKCAHERYSFVGDDAVELFMNWK